MNQASPSSADESNNASKGAPAESPAATTAQTSPSVDTAADDAAKPALPIQKRRRVTRACDECRRKKIKCDGKQPCTHCTVYSYECTYDQPSNRRRNAAPQYIEALETRLKRAEALLNIVLPHVDLNDPTLEASLRNGLLPSFSPFKPGAGAHDGGASAPGSSAGRDAALEGHLESMVRATGQLDLDEQGNWDYHGHSSGLSFVRRMREQFGDIIGPEGPATPFIKSRPMSLVFDSSKSSADSPMDSSPPRASRHDLPPEDVARQLCDNALSDASALLCVVHTPTFYQDLERIYSTAPEDYGNREHTFLPLLYAVLALGSLFSKDHREIDSIGYETAIDEGFKYFKVSRRILDIAECRDLTSLQAIIFMILFLQSSAKLSTCYSYIGVALRSALRMGLHRSFDDNFNPIEAETRKRVFWVIKKMDTYVGALLGLPHTMHDDDIDQDFPTEVDDDHITETEILPMPEGQVCVIAAFNAHTALIHILAKIVRYIYPIKPQETKSAGQGNTLKSYTVSYAKIGEIEKDLLHWEQNLPMGLKPGGDAPQVIIRVQQLLRIAYAHAQMMLYRPFLHYVSQTCRTKVIDKRSWACASKCVTVSRNAIHITAEMKRRCLLVGGYWFTMYTTFFAILSLVFFALENPDNATSKEVLRDATEGKEILTQLAKRSMAADRCIVTLKTLFDQLPDRLRRGREATTPIRKRRQVPSPAPPRPKAAVVQPHSVPNRAGTFPTSYPCSVDTKLASYSRPPLKMEFNFSSAQTPDLFDSGLNLTPTSTPLSMGGTGTHSRHPSFPTSPAMPSFPESTPTDGFNPPLPDLSAMMFPTTDPFAYPHQPVATSDNQKDSPNFLFGGNSVILSETPTDQSTNPPFNTNSLTSSGSPSTATASDFDVQLFGPMPMYMMQGGPQPHSLQQQFQQHQQNPPQQGNHHINLQELFSGEDWGAPAFGQGVTTACLGGTYNHDIRWT